MTLPAAAALHESRPIFTGCPTGVPNVHPLLAPATGEKGRRPSQWDSWTKSQSFSRPPHACSSKEGYILERASGPSSIDTIDVEYLAPCR